MCLNVVARLWISLAFSAKSMKPGSTSIQIHIDKIGLKDAQSYIEPRLTVSVVGFPRQSVPSSFVFLIPFFADYYGKVIDSYDTNVTNKMKATDVVFSENVNLKTTVEELTTDGLISRVFILLSNQFNHQETVFSLSSSISSQRRRKSVRAALHLWNTKRSSERRIKATCALNCTCSNPLCCF